MSFSNDNLKVKVLEGRVQEANPEHDSGKGFERVFQDWLDENAGVDIVSIHQLAMKDPYGDPAISCTVLYRTY